MNNQTSLAVIVLAAGKGTRMKSARAKVLHEVFFQPMIQHVLGAVAPLEAKRTIVIVGHQRREVEAAVDTAGLAVSFVTQEAQNGTGDAVLAAETALSDFNGQVMILCGDSPLLLPVHLQEMYRAHLAGSSTLTIMTTCLEDPTNYGRVISDDHGTVRAVVEEKDATPDQRALREVNAGIYCAEKRFLFEALREVTTDNSQGELYLTDIVGIAAGRSIRVHKYEHPHPEQVLGVNSRVELAQAHQAIQQRRNRELMAAGITMHNPATISVGPGVDIGPDTILTQNIIISGRTALGSNCLVGPGAVITDAELGDGVEIGPGCVISSCSIESGRRLPPLTKTAAVPSK